MFALANLFKENTYLSNRREGRRQRTRKDKKRKEGAQESRRGRGARKQEVAEKTAIGVRKQGGGEGKESEEGSA